MAELTIRPFAAADYPAIALVGNAAFPEYPETADELRFQDEHRDPRTCLRRWVAECDGRVRGSGQYSQSSSSFHPRKFWIWVTVHPEAWGKGFGSRLYAELIGSLAEHDPISLRTSAREDMGRSVEFLARRGFVEVTREWESRLALDGWDPAPFADGRARVAGQGIDIRSAAELQGDPDHWRRMYDCIWDIERDVPRMEPEFTPTDFEHWVERRQANPNRLPEGELIAVHDGLYVGVSELWNSQSGDMLETGVTGVRREYRRRGIALALKLAAIDYARRAGAPAIRTWNNSGNEGMLSINVRLGFVRQPAWIEYRKLLKSVLWTFDPNAGPARARSGCLPGAAVTVAGCLPGVRSIVGRRSTTKPFVLAAAPTTGGECIALSKT